jgi:hypothetical protein
MIAGMSGPAAMTALAAVVLSVATVAGLPAPLQAVAGLAILIVLPGFALVRLMPGTDPALRALLVPALGLAAVTAVSTVMFYLTIWSWQGSVVTMGVLTVLACVAHAWQEDVPARKESS